MRRITWLIVLLPCCAFGAVDGPDEQEYYRLEALKAREAAAADPTIKDRESPPVRLYLAEQKRRRFNSIASLRQRIQQYRGDESKAGLIPILTEHLAELKTKPLEQVSFDTAYGYQPATGLLGYSKKVRLLENRSDGRSVIRVKNIALLLEGLETSQYPSGKFLSVDKAILVGSEIKDQTVLGEKRIVYSATLVDLESLLETPISNRPAVPGVLRLRARQRREAPAGSGQIEVIERTFNWHVSETAIIVCDMWDDHPCELAARRVAAMAPRMNQVLWAARDRGVTIIHAPSGKMVFYAGTPQRRRMQQAKPARPPAPILQRCDRDPNHEPPTLPVDTTLDCDDPQRGPLIRRHIRQHPALDVIGYDGVSDSGEEIFNFCEQEGIKNIVLMGVHTNYCILTRSFGIRQWLRLGKNVVLARDLTDALYDPREPPYISHARGTEMVVEHIERYLCESILSEDLTQVLAGSDWPVSH